MNRSMTGPAATKVGGWLLSQKQNLLILNDLISTLKSPIWQFPQEYFPVWVSVTASARQRYCRTHTSVLSYLKDAWGVGNMISVV